MPRHPPIALNSLSPNKPTQNKQQSTRILRCSRPLYNSQTTHPPPTTPPPRRDPKSRPPPNTQPCSRTFRNPTTCTHPTRQTPTPFHTPTPHKRRSQRSTDLQAPTNRGTHQCLPQTKQPNHPPDTNGPGQAARPHTPKTRCRLFGLLRKEVIQPHLPVRLPCYDLVLITDPTLDGSPHKG